MDYIIASAGLFLAVAAYLNGEKLRGRLNDLEDTLKEKGVISQKDIIDKILKKT